MKKKTKFLKMISSAPVLISLSIVIPISAALVGYAISPNNRFQNDTFEGHTISGNPRTFKLEKVDRLFKISNHSTWNNYQGGAFYNNFYCIAANNFENLLIYDMRDYSLEDVITETELNNSYHCNTIAFGNTFYSPKDKYPLLYISMENPDVHCTNVYRLEKKSNEYVATKVQEIIFPSTKECGIYLPNSYIDHNHTIGEGVTEFGGPALYYSGYTSATTIPHYQKAPENKLRFFKFDMPVAPQEGLKEGVNYQYTVYLADQVKYQLANKLYHDVDSETATQGGFICAGYLFQTFAFHDDPIMRILDLSNYEIVYEDHIGPYGAYDEFENIGIYKDRIFGFGIKKLSIFELHYSID